MVPISSICEKKREAKKVIDKLYIICSLSMTTDKFTFMDIFDIVS